jgi:hypothetical protein
MTVGSATLIVGAAAFEMFSPLLYYPTLQDQPPHTKAVNSLSRSVPNVTCCFSTSVLGRGSFFEICLSHEAEGLMAGEWGEELQWWCSECPAVSPQSLGEIGGSLCLDGICVRMTVAWCILLYGNKSKEGSGKSIPEVHAFSEISLLILMTWTKG